MDKLNSTYRAATHAVATLLYLNPQDAAMRAELKEALLLMRFDELAAQL